jgi:GNAT superfamily N-acetyltransferase
MTRFVAAVADCSLDHLSNSKRLIVRNVFAAQSTRDVAALVPASPRRADGTATTGVAQGQEAEVLAFLATRPTHTAIMSGLIRDNGLVSPLNRGWFYVYRNWRGVIEGVALIGHVTLVEARSRAALEAFAFAAQKSTNVHVIMAETDQTELFWRYYQPCGHRPRRLCRELLFEQREPLERRKLVNNLRQATPADLAAVMQVQAQMAFEESGVNPMQSDPEGFRQRCARRIEQGRVWVWVEGGRLIFKADIIADTPEVNYLEGVWVNPQERRQGYGLRCMSHLAEKLLTKTKSITVLVNQRAWESHAFYRRAGYQFSSYYDTIYPRYTNAAQEQTGHRA